jgi:hypothetical protein
MKNVFLAFVLVLVCAPAFAGSCGTGNCGSTTSRPVVSVTANVARRVVQAPVRLVRRVRARVAARQCRGFAVRASRSNGCGSGSCGS